MHIIHREKKQEPQYLVPIVSQFAIPGHRKTRNRRYNAKGEFIGWSKPKPVVDPAAQRALRAACAAAARKGPAKTAAPFDLYRYRPLPGHILVTRGPLIKEEGGVALPESKWHYGGKFVVVRVGEGVTVCAVGDSPIFGKGYRPKEVWLDGAKFYIGREQAVVGLQETRV